MVKKIFDFVGKHKWMFMIAFAVVAAVCLMIGVDLGGECGAVMAMAVAATVPNVANTGGGNTVVGDAVTTTASDQLSSDLLESDVYEKVVRVRPSNTPIDTITRKIKKENSVSQVSEYYSVGVMPVKATLNMSSDIAASTASPVNIKLKAGEENLFDANDTILVPTAKGADGSFLVLYVQRKTDDGLLVCIATNTADNKFPLVSKTAEIIRVGFAGSEKDAQCVAMSALPTKSTNYCQVFEAQCEESEFQKFTAKEVQWDMTDIEENAVFEMKRKSEFSLMFGAMSKFYDSHKKEIVYTTKGMWWQAGSEFSYDKGAEFNNESLTALAQAVFTGNNGGKRRILFAGSDLIAKFQNLPVDRVVNDTNEYTTLGIDFSTIVTKFGRLEVVHADIFDHMGMSGNGFVLDPENAVSKEFKKFTRRVLDLKSSGVRNTEAVFMQEVRCVNLLNPAAHCRIVAE